MKATKLYVKAGVSLKLVYVVVIRAMILEHAKPVVNVHTERKIKRNRMAEGW